MGIQIFLLLHLNYFILIQKKHLLLLFPKNIQNKLLFHVAVHLASSAASNLPINVWNKWVEHRLCRCFGKICIPWKLVLPCNKVYSTKFSLLKGNFPKWPISIFDKNELVVIFTLWTSILHRQVLETQYRFIYEFITRICYLWKNCHSSNFSRQVQWWIH